MRAAEDVFVSTYCIGGLTETLRRGYRKRFGGWHPEEALRYLPIRDVLRERGMDGAAILDVGSGDNGISTYLPCSITCCDVAFKDVASRSLSRVQGRGETLPFGDECFDAVVSADSLEHIPGEVRPQALAEMVRVSRRLVVVVVPTGEGATRQDERLAAFATLQLGYVPPLLQDHLRNGLPSVEEVRSALTCAGTKSGRTLHVTVVKRDNLFLRELLCKADLRQHWLSKLVFRRSVVLVALLYRYLSFGKCYRAMIVAERSGS